MKENWAERETRVARVSSRFATAWGYAVHLAMTPIPGQKKHPPRLSVHP